MSEQLQAQGVIYQASYRIAAGRPVVHLFGRLTDGRTFVLRDHRQTPHFYVLREQAQAAQHYAELKPTRLSDLRGRPVLRVDVATPQDAPPLRDRLHAAGVDTFEADVRFAYRYLIERGIRGGIEIAGRAQPDPHLDLAFDDPEVAPCAAQIQPKVLSFDIETDPRRDRLLAISAYGEGLADVILVDPQQRPPPPGARSFVDEAQALRAFCALVADYDPDVLTGWNCIDFDLTFLQQVSERTREPLALGRLPGKLNLRPAQGYFGSGSATVPGRVVLDGLDLVRGAFVKLDEYSLNAVALQVLGEGKVIKGPVNDRLDEILRMYREDLDALCAYALADARLVVDILDELDLVRLAFARSRLTGMMPDRVAASIASFDFLYLSELRVQNMVAPTVRSDDSRVHEAQAGGQVYEPVPGLHRNVWVFDFKSLYPSIMRTFNVDPVALVEPGTDADVIDLEAACFRREPAILPRLLNELFPAREAAKRAGDAVASQAIKILMNSMYGVLGTPACRFYNPALANAITGQGRHLLGWLRDWFAAQGMRVLYGDTDSLFVMARPEERGEDLVARAAELAAAANGALAIYIEQRWRVRSALELEFEKVYDQLFLPSVRGGSAGARKRYVGRYPSGDLDFVGLEVVRRDWTDLAKSVQRTAYAKLFAGEALEDFLFEFVRDLRAGAKDEQLVYRKGLRRDLDSYTANTPPHVAAARKSTQPLGRVIKYVMTQNGPEPLDNVTAELDREHYVQKQVRPVVEPVLDVLGLAFDQVVGDDRQLGLF